MTQQQRAFHRAALGRQLKAGLVPLILVSAVACRPSGYGRDVPDGTSGSDAGPLATDGTPSSSPDSGNDDAAPATDPCAFGSLSGHMELSIPGNDGDWAFEGLTVVTAHDIAPGGFLLTMDVASVLYPATGAGMLPIGTGETLYVFLYRYNTTWNSSQVVLRLPSLAGGPGELLGAFWFGGGQAFVIELPPNGYGGGAGACPPVSTACGLTGPWFFYVQPDGNETSIVPGTEILLSPYLLGNGIESVAFYWGGPTCPNMETEFFSGWVVPMP